MLKILFEDNDILVIDKPAGLMVEKDRWDYPSVERQMEIYMAEQKKYPYAGIVHRIDRPVSGVLLLAKRKSVLKKLNDQFRDKQIQKKYFAIIDHKPEKTSDTLIHYLERDEQNKNAIVFKRNAKGRVYCELKYQVVQEKNKTYLLEIIPVTGKFHQIRAQLSFIGCAIIGDKQYRSKTAYKENAICLHAYSLEFKHPLNNEAMKIVCAPSDDKVWKIFHVDPS